MEQNNDINIIDNLKKFKKNSKKYRHWSGAIKVSEGFNYLIESLDCLWIANLIAGYQHDLKEVKYQSWSLEHRGKDLKLSCKSFEGKTLINQGILIEFKLDIKFVVFDRVLMLENEY